MSTHRGIDLWVLIVFWHWYTNGFNGIKIIEGIMKKIILFLCVMAITGCQSLPPPVCNATANLGGQETTVSVYEVRQQANQTQYYAGAPFGWKWVSATNFTKSTCNK